MSIEENDDLSEVQIVESTEQEVTEGIAKLEACLPHWMRTPALLVIKPELGLIVSVLDSKHDRNGFTLRMAVREELVVFSDFQDTEINVGLGWNQPYASFDRDQISAPYSFFMHFGAEGVKGAREVVKTFVREQAETLEVSDFPFNRLRRCFR